MLLTKKNSHNSKLQDDKGNLLENYYNYLGHEAYVKLLTSFDKFCSYGKTVSNNLMDYSQFNNYMSKNNLYSDEIKKNQVDVIFNKTRNNNKSINFTDFISILVEMGKIEFPFENNYCQILNYFYNKRLIRVIGMQKTLEEKNYERWYFFLETPEMAKEISKNLNMFYKFFLKYKVKDLKLGEVIDTNNMIKFCKDFTIIPTFLSSKDIVNVIITYIKYE